MRRALPILFIAAMLIVFLMALAWSRHGDASHDGTPAPRPSVTRTVRPTPTPTPTPTRTSTAYPITAP